MVLSPLRSSSRRSLRNIAVNGDTFHQQAIERVFTACFPLCSLARQRERTNGRKPAFTQGVEAPLAANAIGNLYFNTR